LPKRKTEILRWLPGVMLGKAMELFLRAMVSPDG